MEHPEHRWTLDDVVARVSAAGHDSIGRSRLNQIRKHSIESIKAEVIFALADGLGVTPLRVANAAIESMGIDPRPAEVTDAVATINIDPSLSDGNRQAQIALVRKMLQDPLREHRLKLVRPVVDDEKPPGTERAAARRRRQCWQPLRDAQDETAEQTSTGGEESEDEGDAE